MKIIPVFFITVLLMIEIHQSAQVLNRDTASETQVDFDNDANYNFGNSSENNHQKDRELYQVITNSPYQQPLLQSIPQIQQIPQTSWAVQQPQTYQLAQQPLQYAAQPQPQTIQLQQQQPVVQTQPTQILGNVQQQPNLSNTRLVDNEDTHEERVLHKMSKKNKQYRKLKMKLFKFVGQDRPHYYYQGRHLAQYFCKEHYCSRNLNIYSDNDIDKKIKKKQDKRELCQNKCQKVVEEESQYQTKIVNKMKSSPQKIRILTLFDAIFEDPHFCLNYANDPQHFRKQMCKKQKIAEEKCGIVASVSMQKACNTKKQIFDFHQALIQNQKLKKKGRSLKIDYSYHAFFKSSKPQCSQCRSRSLQYINQFYNFSRQKKLCSKRFKNDYEKKQSCINATQNQYDRKLQNVQSNCEKICNKNSKESKRKLKVIKNIPKYLNSENQCSSYCSKQSRKICANNEQCLGTFPVQCHSKCKLQVQKRILRQHHMRVHTGKLISVYEYFQSVRANYDRENEQQIRQMILYYNRDAIYDAILEMEKEIFENEGSKTQDMVKADKNFEKKMQRDLEAYYANQDRAMQDLDNSLNIFDVEL